MRRTILSALLLSLPLSFALVGCSDNSSPPPKGDSSQPPPKWVSAVGVGGTFAQTFDEVSWQARSLGDPTLFGVACVGNDDGWAVGEHGTIGHTLDGGKSWSWQTSGVAVDLHGVRFGDAMHGVAVGDGGTLLVTSDAGAHWARVDVTTVDLHAATVAWGAGLFFAVGANGTLLRSADGTHFDAATIDGASNLRGIAADVSAHVVIAVDDAGAIFSSTDLGKTFVRDLVAPAPLDAVAMADDGGPAVAVGAHGTVMVRDPIARTWSASATPTDANLHAALVGDDGHVYVAGDGGTLLGRTVQAGWQRVTLSTTAALYGLEDL